VRDEEDVDVRTEAQKEWADWAAHGYRKLYQPRSILRLGLVFCTVFVAGFATLIWLASSGRLP
jgi:hypothetical protein